MHGLLMKVLWLTETIFFQAGYLFPMEHNTFSPPLKNGGMIISQAVTPLRARASVKLSSMCCGLFEKSEVDEPSMALP